MPYNIAVIGGGQLGSRHLQALASLETPCLIHVVDPSPDARTLAEERFRAVEAKAEHQLELLESTAALPSQLDLVILATTANIRLAILQDVLSRTAVANWLLEKVLFQNLDDYAAAAVLFGAQANVWVNCAQRLWPFFIELKHRFGGDPALELQVIGSNWGLGCNAVHNTDIAQFLWDAPLTHQARLDSQVIDSKRSGFKEFTGCLETLSATGGMVRQISYAHGDAPFTFIATHPSAQMIWNVASGKMMEADEQGGWAWRERTLQAPFQSVLTTQVASAILDGRPCGLPTFADAVPVHMGTLEALLEGARAHGTDFGRICPVT